jgi:hypothetical protein
MAKKGFFNRIKEKITTEPTSSEKDTTEEQNSVDQQSESYEEEPLAEYQETLHAKDATSADKEPVSSNLMSSTVYRDVERIEKNIDSLSLKKKTKMKRGKIDTNVDEKVDKALSKKPKIIHKKPPNVIYVVSKPQPGQVKGDWAVRSHGKIFTHHRTKDAAVKKAREIARKRDATVLIQRMDGTFSEGFKPRKKSE